MAPTAPPCGRQCAPWKSSDIGMPLAFNTCTGEGLIIRYARWREAYSPHRYLGSWKTYIYRKTELWGKACIITLQAANLMPLGQGCARLISRESNLTRFWLKWVESELSQPWKSMIWVESHSMSFESELCQLLSSGNCLSQSWVTDFSERETFRPLSFICSATGREHNYSYIRPHAPPVNNFCSN